MSTPTLREALLDAALRTCRGELSLYERTDTGERIDAITEALAEADAALAAADPAPAAGNERALRAAAKLADEAIRAAMGTIECMSVFPPGHSLAGRELTWHRLAVEARAAIARIVVVAPAPADAQDLSEDEIVAVGGQPRPAAEPVKGREPTDQQKALAHSRMLDHLLAETEARESVLEKQLTEERLKGESCSLDWSEKSEAADAKIARLEKQLTEALKAMTSARGLLDFADADEQHAWHVLDKAIRALAKEEA
jgi:hypothetical protein